MTTLNMLKPIDFYIAGQCMHLPRKGSLEEFALAMHVSVESLHNYAIDRDLYNANNVLRVADIQLAISDDVDLYLKHMENYLRHVDMQIRRIAHSYHEGFDATIF